MSLKIISRRNVLFLIILLVAIFGAWTCYKAVIPDRTAASEEYRNAAKTVKKDK
jgi:predicted negative regulator of RcsB-dependent stress response